MTQRVRAHSKEQIYEGGQEVVLIGTAPCTSKPPRKHINEGVRESKRHIG